MVDKYNSEREFFSERLDTLQKLLRKRDQILLLEGLVRMEYF